MLYIKDNFLERFQTSLENGHFSTLKLAMLRSVEVYMTRNFLLTYSKELSK